VFLENSAVTLRPAGDEDISFLRENEQNPRVRASRSVHTPVDTDWARQRLGGTLGRSGDTLGLLICVDETPVGCVYLVREQPNSQLFRFGELAYWVTPTKWGTGYATAGSELLLSHAFNELGLHRIEASAFASNDASRRVLEKLGFSEEGTARKAAFVDGEWTDNVRYGLLEEEWRDAETDV
jgi:RimJ/RimL family protein N-acetyltransferase